MTTPTNVVDVHNPAANMYGCLPCPKCGKRYRWPTQPVHPTHPNSIVCDDCGFIEPRAASEDALEQARRSPGNE